MQTASLHKFHIPVMGLAYTIDSPIKVAHFGITSAISIIEDNLVEIMRKYYYQQYNEPYIPILQKEEDHRARRITDYLNLVNRIVQSQFDKLKASVFETGSDIVKYFEMLPEDSALKQLYQQMVASKDEKQRKIIEQLLRNNLKAGAIEVNIMTKLDKNNLHQGVVIEDGSDAVSALRGYAVSELKNSSIVFSAGMNPRLFNYLEKFDDFDPSEWGKFDKRVIIKVSDYRSALIQGKYLAKKGIWVSEFRIESGLNCGGHAFATDGLLLGPILEEFKVKKEELETSLFEIYNPALKAKDKVVYDRPHPIKITVQGGIGTHEEDSFLHQHYEVDSTGWGTPFLLCPEATTVDEETLALLSKAEEKDVVLSKNSPLGVRFNYLRGTSSDREKQARIDKNAPGSPCTEKFLSSNTEFTEEPICTASRKYQRLKIQQLKTSGLPEKEYKRQLDDVLSKECLCIGLSNAASLRYEVPFIKRLKAVTICPGPNIAYFSKIASLQEMTDHIYGRASILQRSDRPHMFIKELQLYVDYIKEKINEEGITDAKSAKYCNKFCENILEGISYYRQLANSKDIGVSSQDAFDQSLNNASEELQNLMQKIDTMATC